MKIGMLTSTEERCGIAVYSRDLADGLRTMVDLNIVPVWDRTSSWENYLAESSKQLNECDIVHIQHEYSFWGSVLPGQNKFFDQASSIRKPIILTAHTLDPAAQVLGLSLPGSPLRKLAKRILAGIPSYRQIIECKTFTVGDRIIIHDSHAASRLESRGIPKSRIRIIPMGVPSPNSDTAQGSEFRSKYGLEGRTLITVFGFVRPGRGYEAILDVLPILGRDVVLVIAGGPQTAQHETYLDGLSADIETRGLKDQVLVTGYLPDESVPGAMQSTDVVLCPQEAGTGSYSVQVSFGYGCPIVASDLLCFKYLEETAGCLLTYSRDNTGDLASKLLLVLTDESVRKRLSAASLCYAAEHSWEKIAEKTVEVYKELIG